MSGLDKIRTIKDIKNLVMTDTVSVSAKKSSPKSKPKSEEHKAAISKSRTALYASKRGQDLKEKQSNAMKEFYKTPAGKAHRQKLKQPKKP